MNCQEAEARGQKAAKRQTAPEGGDSESQTTREGGQEESQYGLAGEGVRTEHSQR